MFKQLVFILVAIVLSTFAIHADEVKPQVIVIDENTLQESIWIDASGKNGESSRPEIFYGSTPRSGTSGASGGHVTIIVRQLPEKVSISARGGIGGNGANGARGKYGLPGADGKNAGLFSSADDGENGTDGQDGGNGSHGGHGGKGGTVRIVYVAAGNYDPDWRERFEIDVSGGNGGLAGFGALGGVGGPGGLGGKKFWSSSRKASGQKGLDGERGANGIDGSKGEDGTIEFIEVEDLRDFLLEEFNQSS